MMRSPNKILAVLALVTTLTISDFPLIQNPKSKIQKSWALAQTPDARKAEAYRLFRQGSQQYDMSQFEAALRSWQQALIIYREIKDRQGEGAVLGNLGAAYYSIGDYAKAIDYDQQYLLIARETLDRQGEGMALGGLGVVYTALGDYVRGIEYQQQRLAIAQEIGDKDGEWAALNNLGGAYFFLGDYTKAIEYLQQSLALTREIGDKDGEGKALNNLGLVLQKSGNLLEAERTLRTGIEVWESQRGRLGNNDAYKVSIFEQQAGSYRLLQQVLIAQNKPDAALEIAERGRARAFVELLASRNATTNDSLHSPITPPTIELLQQIAKQQNATLVEYSIIPDIFKIKGKEEPHESELYIWVIKPTGEVTFRKTDLKPLWQKQNTSLAKLVTNSRESIATAIEERGAASRD